MESEVIAKPRRHNVLSPYHQEAILELMRSGQVSNQSQAAIGVGVHPSAISTQKKMDPAFAAAIEQIKQEAKERKLSLVVDGFPDFPEWRERFCGYYLPDGSIVRAQNYWFHLEAYELIKETDRSLILFPPFSLKDLALDTPIPTPSGWTTMGEVQVGDILFDEKGQPTTVTGISEVYTDNECFEVSVGGETIVAGADHNWFTRQRNKKHRKGYGEGFGESVVTTREMFETQSTADRSHKNHSVPVAGPLELTEADLPMDPYILGYWLGDGHSDSPNITTSLEDLESLIGHLELAGYEVKLRQDPRTLAYNVRFTSGYGNEVRTLRSLGVLKNKHIPEVYQRASEKQRMALLQGLMDSDGTCSKDGQARFDSITQRLAQDVHELFWSLGIRARINESRAKLDGRDMGPLWSVSAHPTTDIPVFRLDRKANRQKQRATSWDSWRAVDSVTPCASIPTKCLTVDSPSHLFLVGKTMIPTHNTSIWSIEFSTYLITKSRKTRITVIQKSQPEAKKIVMEVENRLTDHGFYSGLGIKQFENPITLYGGENGFKPDKYGGDGMWNQQSFTVSETGWGEKDPTMQAKGWTSSILSNRADYIIMDDIQDGDGYTQADSVKIIDRLEQMINTRLGPESKVSMLGSRLGPGDIYEEIMSREAFEDWPVKKFPAAFRKGTRIPWDPADGEGDPLLPDVWPWDKLMKKRKEVGKAWHTSYMQGEGDRPDSVFTRDKMESARNSELLLGTTPPSVTHTYVGMDPALVNWNVIVVWGLDKNTGIRYLIDLIRRQNMVNWDNVMALLAEVCDLYRPVKVVLENNNTQGHVIDTARRVLGTKGYSIVEYKTATGMGARYEQQDYSISSIGSLYDGSLVQLPWGDSRTREIVGAYIDEFCRWHTAEDGTSVKNLVRDQVMATLFSESEARQEMLRASAKITQPRRRGFARNEQGGYRWSKIR